MATTRATSPSSAISWRASSAPATSRRSRTDPATSDAPYRIYNIGNNSPVKLTEYIEALEQAIGRKSERNLLPLQAGDVPDTFADVSDLERDLGYKPRTSVRDGVSAFVKWYQDYVREG